MMCKEAWALFTLIQSKLATAPTAPHLTQPDMGVERLHTRGEAASEAPLQLQGQHACKGHTQGTWQGATHIVHTGSARGSVPAFVTHHSSICTKRATCRISKGLITGIHIQASLMCTTVACRLSKRLVRKSKGPWLFVCKRRLHAH